MTVLRWGPNRTSEVMGPSSISVQVLGNGGQGLEPQGPLDKGLPGSNASRTGASSFSTILEMPKARRAMLFPAAPVWKTHWCARSVSRASRWSCLEVGTARWPTRWFLEPNSEAKSGSSGGTDGQSWLEKPSTVVMCAYVEFGALSFAGSEKAADQQLMAAGKRGQMVSGQRVCVALKIPAKSSASGGAGSGMASPLWTAAAEMMAGSSWSGALTAGWEQ
nr:uncharacterized protein LOC129154563 [Nothobranchius furzeri]